MMKFSLVTLISTAAIGLSPFCMADEAIANPYYVYGDFGLARQDMRFPQEEASSFTTATRLNNAALQIGVGMQFNSWLKAEVGLVDLGVHHYQSSTFFNDGTTAIGNLSVRTRGEAIHLIGSYPLTSNLTLDGKLGGNFLRTSLSGNAAVQNTNRASNIQTDGQSEHRIIGSVGVGLGLKLNGAATVRASYERFEDVKVSNAKFPADVYTIGVMYHF